jgi:hypothetical protein
MYRRQQVVPAGKEKLPAYSPAGGTNLFKNDETNQLFENAQRKKPYVPGTNRGYSRTPISLPPSKYEIRGKNLLLYKYPSLGNTNITIYLIDKLNPFTLFISGITFTGIDKLHVSNEQMLPSPEGFRQSFYQALEMSPLSLTFPGFPNEPAKSLLNNNSNEALLNISAQRRANLENAFKNGSGPAAAGGGGSSRKRKNSRNHTRKN